MILTFGGLAAGLARAFRSQKPARSTASSSDIKDFQHSERLGRLEAKIAHLGLHEGAMEALTNRDSNRAGRAAADAFMGSALSIITANLMQSAAEVEAARARAKQTERDQPPETRGAAMTDKTAKDKNAERMSGGPGASRGEIGCGDPRMHLSVTGAYRIGDQDFDASLYPNLVNLTISDGNTGRSVHYTRWQLDESTHRIVMRNWFRPGKNPTLVPLSVIGVGSPAWGELPGLGWWRTMTNDEFAETQAAGKSADNWRPIGTLPRDLDAFWLRSGSEVYPGFWRKTTGTLARYDIRSDAIIDMSHASEWRPRVDPLQSIDQTFAVPKSDPIRTDETKDAQEDALKIALQPSDVPRRGPVPPWPGADIAIAEHEWDSASAFLAQAKADHSKAQSKDEFFSTQDRIAQAETRLRHADQRLSALKNMAPPGLDPIDTAYAEACTKCSKMANDSIAALGGIMDRSLIGPIVEAERHCHQAAERARYNARFEARQKALHPQAEEKPRDQPGPFEFGATGTRFESPGFSVNFVDGLVRIREYEINTDEYNVTTLATPEEVDKFVADRLGRAMMSLSRAARRYITEGK